MLKKVLVFLICFNTLFSQWGENVEGVKRKLKTKEKVIALTLDACGSKNDSYDQRLIGFLEKNNIQASLFISGKWIDKYPKKVKALSENELFDIQNHGLKHRPCSIDGKKAYGIKGTENIKEVYEEVIKNAFKIEKITGDYPKFYRSGTAYYDTEAVKYLKDNNILVAGFSVLGDAGTFFNKNQTYEAVSKAKSGDIVIIHMNRPEKSSALGAIKAIKELKEKGYKFVKLKDYDLY